MTDMANSGGIQWVYWIRWWAFSHYPLCLNRRIFVTMTGYWECCQYLTCALTCFQRYISQTNLAKSFPISGVLLHMANVKSWRCFNVVNISQMKFSTPVCLDRDLGQNQNRRILKTIVANNMSSVGQRRENV